jgi:hypothetical protein
MRKLSRKSRNKKRGGAALSYSNVTQPDASGAAKYVLGLYGSEEQQFNNTFNQNNGLPNSANTLVDLKGHQLGGRHRTKRHRKKRGGFIGDVVNQAIVPLTLLGLQQRYKKRSNNSAKTKKRFRK